MTISVFVPTWRRAEVLRRCLAGLERQTRPADEVIVGWRANDEETRALLDEMKAGPLPLRAVLVDGPNVVASLNTGIQAATGELIAITDDDAEPRLDWLARIEEHFASRPEVGGVGGRDHLAAAPSPPAVGAHHVGQVHWFGRVVGNHHLGEGGVREVDIIKGVSMAFRRAALDGIRLDSRLKGHGVEEHWELDLCLKVKRAGWTLIYDPAVEVDHHRALRPGDDRPESREPRPIRDASHNQTYAIARWLPWPKKGVAILYGFVVGTREAPGLATAVERLLRERPTRRVVKRIAAAMLGRLEGLRSAWRASRELPDPEGDEARPRPPAALPGD